ncbi:MAG: metal ABC transporter permease [Patescibacteria group bacterium]
MLQLWQIIIGIVVAIAAAFLGTFVVSRRMSLVADALSHVALPGMGIALMLGFEPFLGGFAIMALAVLGIGVLEARRMVLADTLIGVLFTAALAVGLLIVPDLELIEVLFGDITGINLANGLLTLVGGAVIVFTTLRYLPQFAKITFAPELAASEGVPVARMNLLFLFLLAGTVAIGIKAIGVLLMGALVILPAASARNIARDLRETLIFSVGIGCAIVLIGFFVANAFRMPPGPSVVITGALIFGISLLVRRRS